MPDFVDSISNSSGEIGGRPFRAIFRRNEGPPPGTWTLAIRSIPRYTVYRHLEFDRNAHRTLYTVHFVELLSNLYDITSYILYRAFE